MTAPSTASVRSRTSAPAPTAPHAPETSRWRRLLGPFYVTGIFWYRLHGWGMTILPNWAVGVFISFFTMFFFIALRRIRRGIAANLELPLGPCGWWRRQGRIFRTLWSFAWCLSERYERLSTERRVADSVVGWEHWEAVHRHPTGFILVTAHVGHWEVGSMVPGATERRPVHLVREEEMDPRAQSYLRGLIERSVADDAGKLTVHFAAATDPGLGLRLLQALRRGEVVALQGDRPRAGGAVVPVPLFGRPVELPIGPAALARAAGALLLPVFVFREARHRARVVFRPPVVVDPTADRDVDLRRIVGELAGHIEWAIRHRPHQWFCFRSVLSPRLESSDHLEEKT